MATKDLAERLREIPGDYGMPAEHKTTIWEAADALDRLSEVESGVEGVTECPPCPTCWCGRAHCRIHPDTSESVTDEERAEIIRFLRIARVCEHPDGHEACGGLQPAIMEVAAERIESDGKALAAAAKAEARVAEEGREKDRDWSTCARCKRPSYRTEGGLCHSCRTAERAEEKQ